MGADVALLRPPLRRAAALDPAWADASGARPEADAARGRAPAPRYKQTVASALAVFPVVTAFQAALGAQLADWPLLARALALTVLMTPTITYVTLPLATRLLGSWLRESAGLTRTIR